MNKPSEKAKVRRQIRSRQKRRKRSAQDRLLTWESRPATSTDDGTGLFGGYDVLVRERKTGRPIIGIMVVTESKRELRRTMRTILGRFARNWLARSPVERTTHMRRAALVARQCGWSLEPSA